MIGLVLFVEFKKVFNSPWLETPLIFIEMAESELDSIADRNKFLFLLVEAEGILVIFLLVSLHDMVRFNIINSE